VIERTGITDRAYEPVDLYRAEVESFCRSLEGHEMVGTSAAAAVLTSRVLFACEESLSSGRFVDL
jgi:hypothetical protein